MSSAPSKKQQKALTFRAKQKAKESGHGDQETNDVPEQDLLDDEAEAQAVVPVAESSKKRRRPGEVGWKAKAEAGDDERVEGEEGKEGEGKSAKKSRKEIKQRFILFVGNLDFTTTREDVQKHFAAVLDHTPAVRLLTSKSAPSSTPKSRGIAFLELPHSGALQSALKLHHSSLGGRRVNVELTAGGGGKSGMRSEKIKERNERVGEQRQRRREREEGEEGEHGVGGTQGGEGEGVIDGGRVGEGEGAPKDGSGDKVRIRGGRRVKIKAKQEDGGAAVRRHPAQPTAGGELEGWSKRSSGKAPSARQGDKAQRRRWEPTGANAVGVS